MNSSSTETSGRGPRGTFGAESAFLPAGTMRSRVARRRLQRSMQIRRSTLNAAGLLSEPIFDIRGHVLFQADPANGRFQLDFDGTFRVVYLGTLGAVTGKFVLDTKTDADSVTVRELLGDLGVSAPSGSLFDTALPKLWGVIKLQTNLDVLKNIGIDLELAGVFEVNTTRTDKNETIKLKGIPGDSFAQIASNQSLIDSLNNGSLPASVRALFTASNALSGNTSQQEVRTVIAGSLWHIIDHGNNDREFFIQLKDASALPTSTNPNPSPDLQLVLRNDTQAFTLRAKTLLIEGYGLAISDTVPLEIPANESTRKYLKTKKDKLGHLLDEME